MNHGWEFSENDEFFGDFSGGSFEIGDSIMNFRWQEASTSDKSALMRLDAKCYDYPLDSEDWDAILRTAPANNPIPGDLTDHSATPTASTIGSSAITFTATSRKRLRICGLLRLGTHPDHRQKGVERCCSTTHGRSQSMGNG